MVLGRTASVSSKLYGYVSLHRLSSFKVHLANEGICYMNAAIKTHAGHFQDTLTRISLPSVLVSVRCGELISSNNFPEAAAILLVVSHP